MDPTTSYDPVPREVIDRLVDLKFKRQYSKKLGRSVFVLKQQVDKPVFERHKWMFGYTDIGWTVKYPHHLARILLRRGIWSDPEGG